MRVHGPGGARAAAARAARGDAQPRRTATCRSTGGASTSSASTPTTFRSLDDLRRLPFTTKARPAREPPLRPLRRPAPRRRARARLLGHDRALHRGRLHAERHADLVRPSPRASSSPGGVTKEDVVQIAFDYGLFTGAFGLHQGAERLGASVVPVSSANARRQVGIMRDYRTTALVDTPSHALTIADAMIEMGVNPAALSLRHGLFGAEPWSESMRKEIEEKLEIVATDNYGLSEVMGPGVAGRVPRAERAPPRRGPLPLRGDRPRDARAGPAGPGRRARHHDAHQGGASRSSATGRATSPRSCRSAVPLRPHLPPHGAREGAHRRHAHREGREGLPLRDRGGALRDRGDRAALPGPGGPRGGGGPGHGPRRGLRVDLLRRDEAPARSSRRRSCSGSRPSSASRST